MSLTNNRWFRRIGFAAVAVLTLGTTAIATSPAQAHEFQHRGPAASAFHRTSHYPRYFFGFGHRWHPVYHHWR